MGHDPSILWFIHNVQLKKISSSRRTVMSGHLRTQLWNVLYTNSFVYYRFGPRIMIYVISRQIIWRLIT